MATDRKATTVWTGDLFSGKGTTTFDSSGLASDLPVSWPSRTEEPGGQTSPEELIAAAHSACFSMALSNILAKAGTPPERLETSATVTFDTEGGPHISKIALTVRGTVPGADADAFAEAANAAKDGCPVSKALAGNVEMTVEATLA
ncbi:MAG TPA: OsmC family peroxiredoxin [Egibacteraceae bacterium]